MMRTAGLLALALALCASCSKKDPSAIDEAWSGGLLATGFEPAVLVPGVKGHMNGAGLVTEALGYTSVHFTGTHTGPEGSEEIEVTMSADVLSETRLAIFESTWGTLCAAGEGDVAGVATLEVTSRHTSLAYSSPPVALALECRESLTPVLRSVDEGATTLNAPVELVAEYLLLEASEGETLAELSGCFLPDTASGSCASAGELVGPVEVPMGAIDGVARTGGELGVPPTLVGLAPGQLEGEVRLVNRHAGGGVTHSEPVPWTVRVLPSRLDAVEGAGASMGGIVELEGAGFVGAAEGAGTEVVLIGSFNPDDGGAERPLDLILVPTFASHDRLHYVLDDQDGLGQVIDYRTESGTVSGSFTPRFYLDSETVSGTTLTSSFRIDPLRQVVWLNLTRSYTDGLAVFGLREADEQVAESVLSVIDEVYGGINVDVRRTAPQDYVLFSQVDVTAIDPNGYGLLGYDNTPGKDDGNERLYDHLGGLNALTQQDGYPGYGGVFLESIWAFSLSPPTPITPIAGASERFDVIFDPVRPDVGTPVTSAEVSSYTALTDGSSCSGSLERSRQIQCAVWVLGHIVGGTISHELAHSFGLADPGGAAFHNGGDEPVRLMDSGDDRPFLERAALDGLPEYLCQENFDYLRDILPSTAPDPQPSRSACQ